MARKKLTELQKARARMRRRTLRDDGVRKVEKPHLNRDDGLIWWGVDQCWTPERMQYESQFHFNHTGPPDYPKWWDDPSYNWRRK